MGKRLNSKHANKEAKIMQNKKISQGSLIHDSWVGAFDVIFGANKIIIPFVVIAVLELISVAVLFFAIQPPLLKYVSPIILRFWGRQFLRYPLNLLLISQLFYYIQIVSAIVLGTFAAGLTVSSVAQYYQSEQFSYKTAFKKALIKYFSLIIITVLIFFAVKYSYALEKKILIKIMSRGTTFLGLRHEDWPMLFIVFGIIIAGFVQSLFAFAAPAIVIDNKNFITGIFRNIAAVFKNLFAACVLVIIPLLVYIPVSLLKGNMFELMKRTVPEIVFVVLAFGIFASLFINVFITISTTYAYLLIRGKDDEQKN